MTAAKYAGRSGARIEGDNSIIQPSGALDAKPASSATTGNTAEQITQTVARESSSSRQTSWNWKVKKEIQV